MLGFGCGRSFGRTICELLVSAFLRGDDEDCHAVCEVDEAFGVMVVFDGAGDTTLQSAILDGVFDKLELVMCAALSDFDGDGHFSVQVGLAVLGVFNATLDTRAEVTCVMLSKRLLVFFWLERLDR